MCGDVFIHIIFLNTKLCLPLLLIRITNGVNFLALNVKVVACVMIVLCK